ncbi:MAG: hypothetical protein NC299_09060 [Lachnospiraceae bacterium]|nr:hypothetical protein [Lachnospiraceae bacterium]
MRIAVDAPCTEIECFAYKNGYCAILVNTDFSSRVCPFRKTEKQLNKERELAELRSSGVHRNDL